MDIAENLLSIPGIGLVTVASFLGEIGKIDKYNHWKDTNTRRPEFYRRKLRELRFPKSIRRISHNSAKTSSIKKQKSLGWGMLYHSIGAQTLHLSIIGSPPALIRQNEGMY
ncbi:MAG: transposase [Firmicutes bacterium]|nr:transposase [Bacillota bacterium]